MRVSHLAFAAVGLIALAGCSRGPADNKAANIRSEAENQAAALQNQAANAMSAAQNQANALQSQASNIVSAAENRADRVESAPSGGGAGTADTNGM
ncbi:hypothetical protein [Sphingosinicella sp.]|uniref:hypothetical protein n=1 Tax=Sphingosinicella sp. TaxID=1917971 RepID=UPI004037D165